MPVDKKFRPIKKPRTHVEVVGHCTKMTAPRMTAEAPLAMIQRQLDI